MGIRNYIQNRSQVPAFLINSMPKAGTNLLSKAMSSFPGIFWKRGYIDRTNIFRSLMRFLVNENLRRKTHLGSTKVDLLPQAPTTEEECINIGIDSPQPVPIDYLQNLLQGMVTGSFITGHIPYSVEMANLLEAYGVRSLLILRDPRDVVISHANYVSINPDHFLFDDYQELSKSEQITQSIIGIESDRQEAPRLLDINERYRSINSWRSFEYNYTTFFEKLVGPKGKGSSNDQIEELENIAHHLSIKCSTKDMERIAAHLHGGTATFRKGTIGNWQNHFSDEHKQAFKEVTGDLLTKLGYEPDIDW